MLSKYHKAHKSGVHGTARARTAPGDSGAEVTARTHPIGQAIITAGPGRKWCSVGTRRRKSWSTSARVRCCASSTGRSGRSSSTFPTRSGSPTITCRRFWKSWSRQAGFSWTMRCGGQSGPRCATRPGKDETLWKYSQQREQQVDQAAQLEVRLPGEPRGLMLENGADLCDRGLQNLRTLTFGSLDAKAVADALRRLDVTRGPSRHFLGLTGSPEMTHPEFCDSADRESFDQIEKLDLNEEEEALVCRPAGSPTSTSGWSAAASSCCWKLEIPGSLCGMVPSTSSLFPSAWSARTKPGTSSSGCTSAASAEGMRHTLTPNPATRVTLPRCGLVLGDRSHTNQYRHFSLQPALHSIGRPVFLPPSCSTSGSVVSSCPRLRQVLQTAALCAASVFQLLAHAVCVVFQPLRHARLPSISCIFHASRVDLDEPARTCFCSCSSGDRIF